MTVWEPVGFNMIYSVTSPASLKTPTFGTLPPTSVWSCGSVKPDRFLEELLLRLSLDPTHAFRYRGRFILMHIVTRIFGNNMDTIGTEIGQSFLGIHP